MAEDKGLHKKIDDLISIIGRIAQPIPAIVPANPAIPAIPSNPIDHDLLTKLDTKVDQIQLDVNTLKNQGNIFITKIEFKTVTDVQIDHETRIRLLEKFRDNLMGKMAVMGFLSGGVVGIISIVVNHIWH